MEDYLETIAATEKIRPDRLVSLDKFNELKDQKNTIILDARSREKFAQRHVKGAINLPFTEFTADALKRIIPNRKTKILIYCNNNFEGDDINFADKSGGIAVNDIGAFIEKDGKIIYVKKNVLLALNIPTFINLVGYGYENVYELDELVHIRDKRIEFEGTHVGKITYIDGIKLNWNR